VLVERLPELPMPTLLIWGEQDQIVPLAHAQNALSRLQRGELAVISNCGHLPHVERPSEFVAALTRFLNNPQKAD